VIIIEWFFHGNVFHDYLNVLSYGWYYIFLHIWVYLHIFVKYSPVLKKISCVSPFCIIYFLVPFRCPCINIVRFYPVKNILRQSSYSTLRVSTLPMHYTRVWSKAKYIYKYLIMVRPNIYKRPCYVCIVCGRYRILSRSGGGNALLISIHVLSC